MKTLSVTLTIRNNQLLERRHAMGLSQRDLCAAAGMGTNAWSYGALETLRESPRRADSDEWRPIALALARFHGVDPEELFPEGLAQVKVARIETKADIEDLKVYLGAAETKARMLTAPADELTDDSLSKDAVRGYLGCLSPREEKVVRMRFGIDQPDSSTIDAVAAEFDLSRERVRQIELKALWKLRDGITRSGKHASIGANASVKWKLDRDSLTGKR